MPILLGIDTGGTYTDVVFLDEGKGIYAAAKAPVTHDDLAIGIHNAIQYIIWIEINSLIEFKLVYDTTPDPFARFVPQLIDAGANFIGGCCGANPAFIAVVKKAIIINS
jgi:hypothetical protein